MTCRKCKTANRCDLRDYPHSHDHPGQDAGQLPRDRVFHHRHSGDQRAATHNGHKNHAGKIQTTKVCVRNPGCLRGSHASHERNTTAYGRKSIEQQQPEKGSGISAHGDTVLPAPGGSKVMTAHGANRPAPGTRPRPSPATGRDMAVALSLPKTANVAACLPMTMTCALRTCLPMPSSGSRWRALGPTISWSSPSPI